MIKADENLNISVDSQCSHDISMHVGAPCYYNTETKIHIQMAQI